MTGENALQAGCVKWFRMQYPQRIILSIPNGALLGGKNRYAVLGMLKATGLLRGTPDLLIPEPKAHAHGLFIEIKTEKGKVEQHQFDLHDELEARGYVVDVCRSVDQFIFSVREYFGG